MMNPAVSSPWLPEAMFWTLVVAGLVAWVACLVSNRLDRRDGITANEAPTWLTSISGLPAVVLLFGFLTTAVLRAEEYADPCRMIDPNESWAAWAAWYAAGCFWNN